MLAGGDDDFADFQAAPTSPPAAASITTAPLAAAPVAGTAKPNLMDLLASTSPSGSRSAQSVQPQPFGALNTPLAPQQLRPSSTPATAPAYAAMPVMSPLSARSAVTSPVNTGGKSSAAASTKLGGTGGGFDDLWSMSLGSAASGKSAGGAASSSKSIRDLEKEKAQAGIWGAQSQMRPQAPASAAAAGGFGSFAKPLVPSGGSEPAGDDLLL